MKDVAFLIRITKESIEQSEDIKTKNKLQEYLDYILLIVESDNDNLVV